MKIAYLDIETNYTGKFPEGDQRLFKDFQNHRLTVVGVRVMGDGVDQIFQLVGDEITREKLLEHLAGVGLLVTYNGRSLPDKVKGYIGFDFPVIAAQLGVTLDTMFKHRDLAPLCWQHGLYGGLKKVEATLGIKRQLPGKDGKWATEVWRRYQKDKDKSCLLELLAYNREDVEMLFQVEQALHGKAQRHGA